MSRRSVEFRAWTRGLLPDHRPSWGELFLVTTNL